MEASGEYRSLIPLLKGGPVLTKWSTCVLGSIPVWFWVHQGSKSDNNDLFFVLLYRPRSAL